MTKEILAELKKITNLIKDTKRLVEHPIRIIPKGVGISADIGPGIVEVCEQHTRCDDVGDECHSYCLKCGNKVFRPNKRKRRVSRSGQDMEISSSEGDPEK